MNLEQFAIKAGVKIIDCDKNDWGGAFGYTENDYPNISCCGFKTKEAAYKGWLENKFGKQTSKAIFALLKATP